MPASRWPFPLWTSICDPKFPGFGFHSADLLPSGAQMLAAASDRFNDQDHEAKADGGATAVAAKDKEAERLTWLRLNTGIIYGNRIGRGEVILVNSLDYPGAPGMRELYTFLMKSACSANRTYPMVEASDRVRYAIYAGSPRIMYLLNTEEHLDQTVIVHLSVGQRRKIRLAPGEISELLLEPNVISE